MRLIFLFLIICFFTSVTDAKIRLAVSNAISGSASELGKDVNLGAALQFAQLDDVRIILDKKDDGYEPALALQNTRDFYHSDHTLLFNYLGTPTVKTVFNYVKAKQQALITPVTGADFLRQKEADFVFNLRASYQQEAQMQANYFAEQLQLRKVGLVIQADDFGLSFEKHIKQALKNHGIKPKFTARFKRNSNNIAQAVSQIRSSDVEAVVFIGTYEPMSKLINDLFMSKPKLIYSGVSFVSSDQLLRRIPKEAKVFVTEVVPDPNTCTFSECQVFRRLAKQQKVHINHGSFEGFINAYWLSSAMQGCQEQQTPSCLKTKLATNKLVLLGREREFNLATRQLLNEVFFTSLNLPDVNS